MHGAFRSLARRMQYFGIQFTDYSEPVKSKLQQPPPPPPPRASPCKRGGEFEPQPRCLVYDV